MPRTDDSLLGHIRCTHSNVLLQTFAVATTPVSWLLPARQTTQPISTQTTASPTAPSRFCRHTKRWESALLAALSSTRWDSCDLIWIGRRSQNFGRTTRSKNVLKTLRSTRQLLQAHRRSRGWTAATLITKKPTAAVIVRLAVRAPAAQTSVAGLPMHNIDYIPASQY